MMKLFSILLLVAASVANATLSPSLGQSPSVVPTSAAAFELNRYLGPVGAKYSVGTVIQQAHNTAVGLFDYTTRGGAIGDYFVGIKMPKNAIVKKVWFNCPTLPTSANGATIALKLLAANDLKSALVARSWAALTDGALDGTTVTSYLKATTDTEVVLSIASSTLSAGKIKIFVDYVVSE